MRHSQINFIGSRQGSCHDVQNRQLRRRRCPKYSRLYHLRRSPSISERSDHDHDTPWDETWQPQALGNSKPVALSPTLNALHHLSPQIPFTGEGTVNPGNRHPITISQDRQTMPPQSSPLPRHLAGFGRIQIDCSAVMKATPIYHVCHFIWKFLDNEDQAVLRSAALPFEVYTIWWHRAFIEDIDSPTGAVLSIDRVRLNGCALLRFSFVFSDFVRWVVGNYTTSNVSETLKEGAPTKGHFISNFEHARQRGVYDNQQGMNENTDTMIEKLEKEDKKPTTSDSPVPSCTSYPA
jgi:hypothetical protein